MKKSILKNLSYALIIMLFKGISCLSSEGRIHELGEKLMVQTQEHKSYLEGIGLGERAQGINLIPFHFEESMDDDIDLTVFDQRTPIPQEVLVFDPHKKNTLITTDQAVVGNNPADLKKILDIRLYPTLRNLIAEYGVEIFLGTRREMVAYYKTKKLTPLFEFKIPSSATYYLFGMDSDDYLVVMGGLVSRENITAQLLTLKFARENVANINIIGSPFHFNRLVRRDLDKVLQKIPEVRKGNQVLIVAGCGLEKKVNNIIKQEFKNKILDTVSFRGEIISFTYTPLSEAHQNIHGCIILDFNYGDIMEEIVTQFLEKCHCKYVFTGGAGGFIQQNANQEKPTIGTRLKITRCMNEEGEIASIVKATKVENEQAIHLQIPSIFLETYEWLERARLRGNSIDVETFYMVRAIERYNIQHPENLVQADCGCFISDYVGEQPLRDYSKVYEQYERVLCEFFEKL